jgi:hypothetical protein
MGHDLLCKSGHVIGVLTGIIDPSIGYLKIIFIMNGFIHLLLLALGLTASLTVGFPYAPGLTLTDYRTPAWDATVDPEGLVERLLIPPGSAIMPVAWGLTVALLLGFDCNTIRSVLVDPVQMYDNRIDMAWWAVTSMYFPVLSVLIVTILGKRDILHVLYGMSFTGISTLFAFVAEEIQTIVVNNSVYGQPQLKRDISWILVLAHVLITYIVIERGISSFVIWATYMQIDVSTSQVFIAVLFVLFQVTMAGIHVCNHILYNKLSNMRPDRCNLLYYLEALPKLSTMTASSKLSTEITSSDQPQTQSDLSQTERTSLDHPQTQSDPPPTERTSFDQPQAQSDPPQTQSPVTDLIFENARNRVGVLILWRRHYVVTTIVNALLLVTLQEMTGVGDGSWVVPDTGRNVSSSPPYTRTFRASTD